MNTISRDFKDRYFESTWKLSRKFLPETFVGYIIFYLIIAILGFLFLGSLIDKEMLSTMFGMSSSTDPNEIMEQYKNMGAKWSEALIGSPVIIFKLIVFYILLLILSAWLTHYTFLACNNKLNQVNIGIGALVKKSFDFKAIKNIIVLSLVIIVACWLFIVFAGVIGALLKSVSLGLTILIVFLSFLFLTVALLRMILAYPAVSVGEFSWKEALRFSLKTLNWRRGFLMFLSLIVVYIILALIFFIVFSLVGLLLAKLGAIGIVLQFLISIFINVFIYNFLISAFVGMFYRYAEIEEDTEENYLVGEEE